MSEKTKATRRGRPIPVSAAVLTLLAGLVVFYAMTNVRPENLAGTWLHLASQSSVLLFLVAPIAGAGAAWEASRYRKLQDAVAARTPARVVLDRLWPWFLVALGGYAVGLAAMVLKGDAAGSPSASSFVVVATVCLVLCSHVVAGHAVGGSLPPSVSVPASLIVGYVWIGFGSATSELWVRYLTGFGLVQCCTVDRVLDPRALLSINLFALAVILLSWAWIHRRAFALPLNLALGAVGLLGAATALTQALPLTINPDLPRSADELVCRGTAPEICLYPEDESRREASEPIVQAAYRNFEALGFQLPPRITTAAPPEGPFAPLEAAELHLFLNTTRDPARIAGAVGHSLWNGNYRECPTAMRERLDAMDVLELWAKRTASQGILDTAGMEESLRISPDPKAQAFTRLIQLPPEQQREWFLTNSTALVDCAVEPTAVPGVS